MSASHIPPISNSDSTENQKIQLNNMHNVPSYAIAIGTILCLGGLFLTLSAHQILPSGINAISSLGMTGQVISYGLLATGFVIGLVGAVKLSYAKQKPSITPNNQVPTPNTEPTPGSNQPVEDTTLPKENNDPLPKPNKPEEPVNKPVEDTLPKENNDPLPKPNKPEEQVNKPVEDTLPKENNDPLPKPNKPEEPVNKPVEATLPKENNDPLPKPNKPVEATSPKKNEELEVKSLNQPRFNLDTLPKFGSLELPCGLKLAVDKDQITAYGAGGHLAIVTDKHTKDRRVLSCVYKKASSQFDIAFGGQEPTTDLMNTRILAYVMQNHSELLSKVLNGENTQQNLAALIDLMRQDLPPALIAGLVFVDSSKKWSHELSVEVFGKAKIFVNEPNNFYTGGDTQEEKKYINKIEIWPDRDLERSPSYFPGRHDALLKESHRAMLPNRHGVQLNYEDQSGTLLLQPPAPIDFEALPPVNSKQLLPCGSELKITEDSIRIIGKAGDFGIVSLGGEQNSRILAQALLDHADVVSKIVNGENTQENIKTLSCAMREELPSALTAGLCFTDAASKKYFVEVIGNAKIRILEPHNYAIAGGVDKYQNLKLIPVMIYPNQEIKYPNFPTSLLEPTAADELIFTPNPKTLIKGESHQADMPEKHFLNFQIESEDTCLIYPHPDLRPSN